MENNNQGDNREKKTPEAVAPGQLNKSANETEFEKMKKDLDEKAQKLNEAERKLAEKELQASQLTFEVSKLRTELRKPLFSEVKEPEKKVVEDDNFNQEEDDVEVKVEQKLAERDKSNYIKTVNRCFEKFQKKEGVDFNTDLDLQFRKVANKTHLGDSEDEIMETFQIIYNGISSSLNQQNKKEEKKEANINVGDGGNEETIRPKRTGQEWLTRKLNRFEQAAASCFTGGEKAYRQKMQEIADRKIS